MPFLAQGKTNWKYIIIVLLLAIIVGGGILGWIKKQEFSLGELPEIEKPEKIVKLDLSTPEKTFNLYTEAIKTEDFNLMRRVYSKKQQDLVERNINLMQEAVNKGDVLWKAIFFIDKEQKDFVVKINSEHSGYVPKIGERETYNKLYTIEFNVGSGTYATHFVNEDGEWRIPGDWDKYDYESVDTSDWKIYKNEEYGFEVKYPTSFYVEEIKPSKSGPVVFIIDFADEQWKEKSVHNPAVYIYVIETALSPQEWLDENGTPISVFCGEPEEPCPEKSYLYYGVSDVKQISINNIPVLQFRHFGASGGNKSTLFRKEPYILYKIDAHSSSMGIVPQDIYDQMLSTFRFIEQGIKTGKVEINYEKMAAWQQSVDEGHQPWRLNSLMVLRAEMGSYGFNPDEDFKTLSYSDPDIQERLGEVSVEITHEGKVFIITLIQPIPGEGKIWTILEIELKK